MERMELEVRRGLVGKRCVFHGIGGWSLLQLCKSIQLECKAIFIGGVHNHWCGCTQLQEGFPLLIMTPPLIPNQNYQKGGKGKQNDPIKLTMVISLQLGCILSYHFLPAFFSLVFFFFYHCFPLFVFFFFSLAFLLLGFFYGLLLSDYNLRCKPHITKFVNLVCEKASAEELMCQALARLKRKPQKRSIIWPTRTTKGIIKETM